MQAILNAAAFTQVLTLIGAACKPSKHMPALHNVRLVAGDQKIAVYATDMTVYAVLECGQVQIERDGECLVNRRELLAAIESGAAGTYSGAVTIAVEGGRCSITGDDSRTYLPAEDLATFPPVAAQPAPANALTLPGRVVRRLIKQSLFAAAAENARYAFDGVLFEAAGRSLQFVGTDGRRLAVAAESLASPLSAPMRGIMYPSFVKALDRFAKRGAREDDATVTIWMTDGRVSATVDGQYLSADCLDGQYPPYGDVLGAAKSNDKTLTAGRAELLDVVKRLAKTLPDDQPGLKIVLGQFGAQFHAGADSQINFPCRYRGDALTIGLNATYLAEALAAADADDVTITFSDSSRAAAIRVGTFEYVVMPTNLAA